MKCLERHLEDWKQGNISDLLLEGRSIQQRIPSESKYKNDDNAIAKRFSKFMKQGKTRSAIRLLSKFEGSLLKPNETLTNESNDEWTVLVELKSKHPPKGPTHTNAIITDKPKVFHPVIFESIDSDAIQKAALNTNGSAGPSGIDAVGWRRLCLSFKYCSTNLCNSLSLVAKKLSTEYVDPAGIDSLIASHLIAIDNRPGVRPIAIGKTSRRIIGKTILAIVKDDVKEVAGSIQLCAGQEAGCEAGVRAMKSILENEETEAAILVYASNAFNFLNRQTALINCHYLCPSIATILTNMYRGEGKLFIEDQFLLSCEGTMQGDPLAMSMYALGVLPLIQKLDNLSIGKIWFANDAAARGEISSLKEGWNNLNKFGPDYGYFPNHLKMRVIVKEERYEMARSVC